MVIELKNWGCTETGRGGMRERWGRKRERTPPPSPPPPTPKKKVSSSHLREQGRSVSQSERTLSSAQLLSTNAWLKSIIVRLRAVLPPPPPPPPPPP